MKGKKMDRKLNTDAEPQGSSSGFWYDLTDGGYIELDKLLTDKPQIKAAKDAVDLLKSLELALNSVNLLSEF